MKIIINADDYGISYEVSKKIITLLQKNKITSTTVLCTSPYFDDSIELLKSANIDKKHLGIHLDIREFKPLNKKLIHSPFVDENHNFKDFRIHKVSVINKIKYFTSIVKEINLQIKTFYNKLGHYPSHLDSHGHIHTTIYILLALIFSKEFKKIKKIRLSREYPETNNRSLKWFLKKIFNIFLKKSCVTTDIFIGLLRVDEKFITMQEIQTLNVDTIEIMCHPGLHTAPFDDFDYLYNNFDLKSQNISYITYSDLIN